MEDLKRQLAELRLPIARIDRNYAGGSPRPGGRMPLRSPSWKNRHRRHGSVDIADLFELLAPLSDGACSC